jgi:hypothetical protein
VARIYRLQFDCVTDLGTLVMPSLHYQTDVPAGGDEPDPSDVASAVWSHLGSAFKACFSSHTTVTSVAALEEVLPPDIGVAGTHTVGEAGTLAGSGDSTPDAMTVLVNLHTNTRSRSARGWLHMPPPRWADRLSVSGWDGTMMTAIGAFAALLDDQLELGTLIITDLNPVVYSKTRRQREEDPFTFRVTSATGRTAAHWLRSRMTAP